jgi:lipopolysaccharide/colanic/teichoic acid biosynthesis glycosyltransferase
LAVIAEMARSGRMSRGRDALRVVIEAAIAATLLCVALPVLAVIGTVVKLESRGPVIFRQRRLGRFGQPFTMLKFRTMTDGAPSELHQRYIAQLAEGNGAGATGDLKKLTDDPRVTRIGALLRRLSLDELPQLINVVRGEMSIIGPRPALEYELTYYRPEHFERFLVRPGLTGLWQVSGRARLGFGEMLDLDLEYVRNRSLRLDLRILRHTPRALIGGTA